MGGQPQPDMIVLPQTQPDPKGTSHERKIQSRERQVANHHASPRARCVSDRPSRYPSRTHSVTRDRSDFPVSSAAARETRLDGTSTKSGGAGDSDTSICPCTRPATLRDSRRRALTGGLSVPSSSNARSRSLTSCPEISPAARSRSWLASGGGGMALPSRMAGLLLGRACLFGHLGPNSPPVIGPQFASSNRACRGMFDRDRSLGRNRRQTGCHLGQVGRRDGQRLSQARGRATRAIRNVGFEVHAPSLVCTKRHGQVFTNLVTYKLSA
ncbi:Uncharacterised protein [Achromobacter sp. 2789STDY5608628]|nr:Uncharacterised protein [Achromobacter sp. 2789STDY5608628]